MIIEAIFNKSPNELTYSDIETFFSTERFESDTIEFKSFAASESVKEREKGILKTISAFLNSSGGLLVWGAPVGIGREGQKVKSFIGQLTPVDTNYEKDSFINKVTDSIVPFPNGIFFNKISGSQGSIYIIEVTRSQYAPHQFSNTYFMRIDGQTRPAPHHYIESLFKQISYPRLAGYMKNPILETIDDQMGLKLSFSIFNLTPHQNELNHYYSVQLYDSYTLINYSAGNRNRKFYSNNQLVVYSNADHMLNYGIVHSFSEYVLLGESDRFGSCEVDVELRFGGEKSPQLVSIYRVSKSKGYRDFYISSSEENVNAYDYSLRYHHNIQSMVNTIVGRNVKC